MLHAVQKMVFSIVVGLVCSFKLEASPQSIEQLRAAADEGEAKAQFELGKAYDSGDGVLPDINTALEWYRKAAEQGHAQAHYFIALTHDFGDGVIEDNVEAVKWYTTAANLDWAPAQATLGLRYENGEGVPADVSKARFWYKRAAQNGEADAYGYLADLYNRGIGVEQDVSEAIKLFAQGAAGGSFYSQLELAEVLLLGAEEFKNIELGLAWLLIAEETADDEDDRIEVNEVFRQASPSKASLQDARRVAVKLQSSLLGEMVSDDDEVSVEAELYSALQRGLLALGYYEGDITREKTLSLSKAIEAFSSEWGFEDDEPTDAEVLLQVGAAVAFEVMDREAEVDTDLSVGTGFFVSKEGHIITNAHVVEDCSTIRLEQGTELNLQSIDTASDLALLIGPRSDTTKQLSLRSGIGPRVAEDVWTAGFPLSGYLTSDLIVSKGTIMALSGLGEDRRNLQISAPVQPGNSGGPILDSSARVVGVVVSGLNALGVAAELGDLPENVNFGVSIGTLQSFLDTHSIDYDFQSDVDVLAGPEIARRAQGSTVAIFCD